MQFPPPSVEPTSRRIRVRLGGEVVADSSRAQLLLAYGPGTLPTYYMPREDVAADALVDESRGSDGRRRWAVSAGRSRVDAGAWEHPDPTGPMALITKQNFPGIAAPHSLLRHPI